MTQRKRAVVVVVVCAVVLVLGFWLMRSSSGQGRSSLFSDGASRAADGEATVPAGGAPVKPPQTREPSPRAETPKPTRPAQLPEVIAELGWGSGAQQLGRDRPQEANPEAPMSLAVTPLGDILVMDQINGRLMRLGPDGKVLGTTPLTQQVPQDITVARDGSMLVLDRLRDRTVAILDPYTGTLKGELPLQGKGLPEPGLITGTFVDGDSVYVEREHGALVRIGDVTGKADPEQPEIPGRPSRDGRSYLVASIIEAPVGRILINAIDRQTNQRRYTREYRLQFPVLFLMLLDADRSGTIYLAVAGQLPTGNASPASAPGVRLFCMEPVEGRVVGQVDLPLSTLPEETFRTFTVLDEGGVIYQLHTDTGVSLRRADCR